MALLSTLTDNFDDNSLDAAKWSNWGGGQVAESSQRINMSGSTGGGYYGMDSVNTYDATSNGAYVEVVSAGNTAIASWEVYPVELSKDTNNQVWWVILNASGTIQIRAYKKVAGVQTQVGASITYNSTTHRWFRIRESGGTTFFDTSTDGSTWTNRQSLANPFVMTAVSATILIGNWQPEASSTTANFDNFNLTAASTQTLTIPQIASTNVLYTPTISPQAITISLPVIAATSTAYAPNLTQAISLPVIASAAALYAPAVTPQAITITMPLLSNASTMYTPVVSNTSLSMPMIASSNVLYAPTIAAGATTITLPQIASGATLYMPTLTRIIGLPFIVSGAVVGSPLVRRLKAPLTTWQKDSITPSNWQKTSASASSWRKSSVSQSNWRKTPPTTAQWRKTTVEVTNWE